MKIQTARICCKFMESQLTYTCKQHEYPCPDVLIVKGKTQLYLESPNATYDIKFCPMCGKKVKYDSKETT